MSKLSYCEAGLIAKCYMAEMMLICQRKQDCKTKNGLESQFCFANAYRSFFMRVSTFWESFKHLPKSDIYELGKFRLKKELEL